MKRVQLLFGCQTLFLWSYKTDHDRPGWRINPTQRGGTADGMRHAQGSAEPRGETQAKLARGLLQGPPFGEFLPRSQ